MENNDDFVTFLRSAKTLTAHRRPLRMRLAHPDGISDDVLLPQRVSGSESMCGGLEYRIDCVATDATLPLKRFLALPVELQFVTDRGGLRKVCGIVTDVRSGHSDGGLATYQLVVRDALAVMERRVNTRVFRNASEIDIIETLLVEWRQRSGILAAALDIEFDRLIFMHQYPKREFTKQHNESDAAFMRRLMRRRGIAWFFRAGRAAAAPDGAADEDTPAHTLVLFDDAGSLRGNAAGMLRFHRDHATEQRDTVTAWGAARSLRPASVSRHSWNYQNPLGTQFMSSNAGSGADQGESGNALAASLNDYLVEVPHVGADHEDQAALGRLRMNRHDYEGKCFHAESSVRDLCVGEWNGIGGHPELDVHPEAEREFVVTELSIVAENNVAPALDRSVRALFERNRWDGGGAFARAAQQPGRDGAVRYTNSFSCVRRGVAIVPAFDPRRDVPQAQMESAIVVGPPGEEIHCDELGRVKLRFPATRTDDHRHAAGAGASDTGGDSAWVRVASNWAGPGPGATGQAGALNLPRVGSEVLISYLGGDPDRPVIVGQVYNRDGLPPALGSLGGLPGNKSLSGMQSRELHGVRANRLRLDDTHGQISAQLASEHGASELNLGCLTQPRLDGQGAARGEGAELRSDKAVALRGAEGILLTADARPNAQGAQLDRAELIGVVEVLNKVAEELARFATTHAGDDAAGPHVAKLIGMLKAWDGGGGAPIIAASAPAGMVMASQDSLALGAANKIDVLCGGDTQLSAGRKLLARAMEGINLFSLRLGMKLIAATGDIRLQAHDGSIEITALKRIKLTAGEGVDINAPEVLIATKGARADYGAGKIAHQCSGDYAVKSARFVHAGPGGANPAGVEFPTSTLKTDERVMLFNRQTGQPVAGRPYTLRQEDGKTVTGVTDASGRTEQVAGDALREVDVAFHPSGGTT